MYFEQSNIQEVCERLHFTSHSKRVLVLSKKDPFPIDAVVVVKR